jgi:hypothetical protein
MTPNPLITLYFVHEVASIWYNHTASNKCWTIILCPLATHVIITFFPSFSFATRIRQNPLIIIARINNSPNLSYKFICHQHILLCLCWYYNEILIKIFVFCKITIYTINITVTMDCHPYSKYNWIVNLVLAELWMFTIISHNGNNGNDDVVLIDVYLRSHVYIFSFPISSFVEFLHSFS